jgi:hypothetical protein
MENDASDSVRLTGLDSELTQRSVILVVDDLG